MISKTRKTAMGTEYWDNVAKKVLYVPKGQKPNFEVTENPKSMLMGVDLATGKDKTALNGEIIDTETDINLDDMGADELRSFADQNNIEVPGNIKKEETIRKYIEEALTSSDAK